MAVTVAGWSTYELLKERMGLTSPSASDKTNLVQLADNLKAEFEKFLGRRVLEGDVTCFEFFEPGDSEFVLSVTPIDVIVEVRAALDRLKVYDDVHSAVVAESLYGVREELNMAIWINTPNAHGLRVEYYGGYAELPGDIARCYDVELKKEWQLRKSPAFQNVQTAGGSFTVETPFGLSGETKRMLMRYRVLPVIQ